MKNTLRNAMLGLTLIAATLGAGAVAANAAPLGIQDGFGESYVPACPGDGYVWTAGYYNAGYWVPGAWIFRGRPGLDRRISYGGGYGFDRGRGDYGREPVGYDRGRAEAGRGFARGNDHRDNRGDNRGNDRGGRGFGGGHFEGGHQRRR
ncbi:hypothetical protein [Acidicapsa ligni]|uniref:hypothetical protein n=1 Tax=Acidicapsa ligni TaxID=542300 RepID=UPI0021DF5805|nr:hypothetical protein [Acidicapsa ligni]